MIGRTLGNYRITEQIGMGGMATVFKAYDPGTDRYIALKVLPDYYSQDPKFRQRFEREAKAIAKLEHLHILPVHAYGEDGNTAYLVMRYMATGTLKERIQAGPMQLAEISHLLKQIASALDYAHQHGIVHRDVKPSNVLLDGESNAYLTDFGIAKMVEGVSELTGSGIIGTPQYMSPEQCQGRKDLTGATDIYSLGVMLYEMIAGRTPYEAETPLAIIHMQLTGAALPPPRSLRPDLPEEAEAVILKALAAEPSERWPSCGAMAGAFARAIAAEETATRPAPSRNTAEKTIPIQKIALEENFSATMPAATEFEEDLSATMPAAAPVDADFATTAPMATQSQPALRRLPRWGWAIIGGLAIVVVLVLVGVGFATGLFNTAQQTPTQQGMANPQLATGAPSGGQVATTAEQPPARPAAGGKTKVGLSFSDFATERWKNEADLLTKLLNDKGYDVIVQEANHDVQLQNDQIDNMVSQGVKGLIVIAEDGDAAATSVDKAVAAGVKVIAYDRLVKTPTISAYLSFNNVEVGRQEALGVMTALGIPGSTTWTKDNPAKVVLSGGALIDNNAHLVRAGQMEVIQPYIDQGIIKIVADQWVDNWDTANAQKMMENILTAQQNKIDAVIASNDGTALGELTALRAQGLAGKVPISGQDATADGCNSIVKGEQTVSVYKDIRQLSPMAVNMMDALLKGQAITDLKPYTMAELTGDNSRTGNVQCLFLPVQQVTKDNVYDLIVKSCFQPFDDVYRDIPADQQPEKVTCP